MEREPGIVVYTFNSSAWKAEAGRPLWVCGKPNLNSRLPVIQNCI